MLAGHRWPHQSMPALSASDFLRLDLMIEKPNELDNGKGRKKLESNFGAITLGATAIAVEKTWEWFLFSLMGALLIVLVSVLTVTVDHQRQTLNLHYRSLLRVSTKACAVTEVRFVNIAEDSEGEGMYRVEVTLRSGQVVPLSSTYSGGKRSNE